MTVTHQSVSISDLKARLSEYLRRVKHGEQWIVTERGRPIAILGPSPQDLEGLKHLAAVGAVRLGQGILDPSFWDLPAPKDPTGTVRKAVLEERDEGW